MFAGQIAVVAWFVLRQAGPFDYAAAIHVLGGGVTISLSVITGLPAVLAAVWVPIRLSRTPFADYLALRWTSWVNLLVGIVAMAAVVVGWDMISRLAGREVTPGFMGEVLQSARADGALWLLLLAFCVAAPVSEEFFARGFLYRGWSESFSGRPVPSCCRHWFGRRCICNTTGSFSARYFRSAWCSAICAIAANRSG